MAKGDQQIEPLPNKNFDFENLHISRVFPKFDGGLKMSKKRSNYELRFPPQLWRTQKKLSIFGYFWEQYWSQGDQILPSFLHQ